MFRRSGRGRLMLVVFLALSIVVITLDFQDEGGGPLDRARDISTTIVAPIQRGVSVVVRPVRDFFSSIGDLSSLRSENEDLQDRLGQYRVEAERAEAVEDELEELRAETGLDKPWFNMDSEVADVIAEQAHNYKWAVIISKGSDDGIEEDMAVVDASAGGLVGRTVGVTGDTATVLLLTDPDAAARAVVSNSKDAGLITGNGGDEDLSMELVNTDTRVSVGDKVVTSYYNKGIFPPSIPVGTVSSVEGDEAGLDQDIEVEPLVDFENLQTLTVLLETGPIETKKERKKR
ncbi:MAG: rod shape-determining protein MreC [Actinomycetota bacterium]|nr:rod shape-determining protein MreC [Actinomycetota bacterium]